MKYRCSRVAAALLAVGFTWSSIVILSASGAAGLSEPSPPRTEAPRGAQDAGLTALVFEEDFTHDRSIDLENTKEPGFGFYVSRPFGWRDTEPDAVRVADGILTIQNPENRSQFDLASAAAVGDGKWVGFAHRGAAYFEAAIAFDPKDIDIPNRSGFPAFWTMSAEHLFDTLWVQTRARYEYLEIDFMEWNTNWHPAEVYIQSIHAKINEPDEDGRRRNRATSFPRKQIRPSDPPDWRQFNVFGVLWIPGERIDAYFNNQHMRSISLKDHPEINVGHDQHYPVILGSGNFPMQVDWVRVWAVP